MNKVPRRACSIGMEDIMRCANFLVVASGIKKAPLIKKMFESDHIDPRWPVSFSRMHPNCIFIIDEDVASQIDPAILPQYK